MRVFKQTSPTTWGFVTLREPPKSADLPLPYVISDTIEPTEQVDGKFYTSKAQFRAVGRALGLTEVGNEKPQPRKPQFENRAHKEERRNSIKKAMERFKSGHRPQHR